MSHSPAFATRFYRVLLVIEGLSAHTGERRGVGMTDDIGPGGSHGHLAPGGRSLPQ